MFFDRPLQPRLARKTALVASFAACLLCFDSAAFAQEKAIAPGTVPTPAPTPAATPVPPAPAETLTFKQAIERAVEKSPSLRVTRLELEAKELEFKNAFSVFLPQLDLSTSAGLRETNPATASTNRVSTLQLDLQETLYDNGISLTRYESARIARDIAKISYENERDRLALSVGQEFLSYSQSKVLVDVQTQQLDIINKQYTTVSSQYRQGIRTRRDYLRFRSEQRRAEIDVQQAQNVAQRSRVELNRLLGVEIREDEPSLNFAPLEIQYNVVENLPTRAPNINDHFQYRIAKLQREIVKNDVRLVTRQLWPQLNLTAGATYTTGDYLGTATAINNNEFTSWYALGTLNFNIWDWGIRRRNISIAKARANQQNSQLDASLNTFSAENSRLMLDLNERAKSYSLARELLDLENSSYGLLSRDYRDGKVAYVELIVALRDLLNAKRQLYSAYFGLREQLLRYNYHEGRLFESVTKAQ